MEPLRSTKKKIARGESSEGTSSTPLLLSDWSDVQLAAYCDACGIKFIDPASDCLNHIRMLEQSRSAPCQGTAVTSSEVREI